MAACQEINNCLFYKKFKNDRAAKIAFIDTACANNYPCARKIYYKQSGKVPSPNFTPAGSNISKQK